MNLDSKTISLAKGPNYAAFTTLFSDGIPQTHVMWVDTDGENLLINTEIHRYKYKNVKKDPRVTVMIWKHDNPFKFAEIRGEVVGEITGQDARDNIDKLSEKYFPNVNVINFSGSGIETTFTQGEDACLEAVIRSLPSSEKTQLAVLGALPDIVQDQMMRLLEQLGLKNVFVLPQVKFDDDVSIGENTHFICVQPFLGASYEEMVRRGAKPISANFPFGAEGTTKWLWAIAERFGISKAKFDTVVAAPKLRAEQAVAAVADGLRGKSVFFFPDSQLEIPLARFLAAECGMELTEVGSPFIHKSLVHADLEDLPATTQISEGQDVDKQLDRVFDYNPDLTVCGLGLANPLESKGLSTKWAIELVFSPIHFYEQAADLASLFSRPLKRAELLKVSP